MSGETFMRSGPNGFEFFGLDNKGEMKPVHELLRVTCGDDFGKFARLETIFYYNPHSPSSEIHDNFWFDRKFRILFVPDQKKGKVVWMNGMVESWSEYNMGPGDYQTKWELNAIMEEPCDKDNIGPGSLVSIGSQLALVTDVQEDKSSGETTYQLYRTDDGSTTNGHSLHEVSCPWSGKLKFLVINMNVNGGGIVYCRSMEKLENNKLSLEWLVPRSEETVDDCWYHCPQKQVNGGGDESIIIHDPDIIPLRKKMLDLIEEIMVNDVNDGKDPMDPNLPKEVRIMRKMYFMSKKKLHNIANFRKQLLCIPSLCYEGVVLSFMEYHQENKKSIKNIDWNLRFQILLNSAIYICHDKEWNMSCWHKGMNRVPTKIKSDKQMNFCLYSGLYRLTSKIGEWYEDNEEYRAAIWAYEHNLAMSRDKEAMENKQDRLNCEHSQLYYIALAHKKMGNYLEASKFYEKSILVTGTKNIPSTVKDNTKILQEKASQWFGTSGHLTKWRNVVDSDGNDNVESETECHVCGERAASKCSSCRLVSYCSRDCQAKHWSVHKHTCLGKYCAKKSNKKN